MRKSNNASDKKGNGLLHKRAFRQRGIALVGVLWIVALLSMVALGVSSTVRSEIRMARNMLSLAQAQYAAEGAIELAVSKLLSSQPDSWPTDGSVRQIRIANAQVRVAIYDEAGRIDLNYASAGVLSNVLDSSGIEDELRLSLVDAIMDWRDPDELRRLYGAENDDYSAAGLPYGAKNAKFDTVDELALVLGMRPDILQAIRPVLTVYSGRPGIDPSVAPEQALQVFAGGDSGAVDTYIDQRSAFGAGSGSVDTDFIDKDLVKTSGGSVFTIHVESRVDTSIVARLAATISFVGGKEAYRLLGWKQGTPSIIEGSSAKGPREFTASAGWASNE